MKNPRLLVASVVNETYSRLARVHAVTSILAAQGFEYDLYVDMLWYGWPSKLDRLFQKVREVAADGYYTHLMFIDAADVVVLGSPGEVMRRYLEFGHPWVYNAEPFIWSPNSFQPEDYPTPDCIYRYLNAGASIGEIRHMLHWIDLWTNGGRDTPVCHRGDQDWVAARFIENYPEAIQLDHSCKLFQCMCGSQVGDDPHVTVTKGMVHNNITGTDPVVIHFNGGTDITDHDRRGLWDHLI